MFEAARHGSCSMWGLDMERVKQETIQLAMTGDLHAFDTIVDGYRDALHHLAFNLLNHELEAEDAVQETFLRVFQHVSEYDNQFNFTTWVYRIATNVCIDRLRRRKFTSSLDASVSRSDGTVGHGWYDCIPCNVPSPEEETIREETCIEVREALLSLPQMYRTILILRYIQELSLREISEILSVPLTTVKTRIHRGRLAMQRSFLAGTS